MGAKLDFHQIEGCTFHVVLIEQYHQIAIEHKQFQLYITLFLIVHFGILLIIFLHISLAKTRGINL